MSTLFQQRIKKTYLDFSKGIFPPPFESSPKALSTSNIFWGLKVSGSVFFYYYFSFGLTSAFQDILL